MDTFNGMAEYVGAYMSFGGSIFTLVNDDREKNQLTLWDDDGHIHPMFTDGKIRSFGYVLINTPDNQAQPRPTGSNLYVVKRDGAQDIEIYPRVQRILFPGLTIRDNEKGSQRTVPACMINVQGFKALHCSESRILNQ